MARYVTKTEAVVAVLIVSVVTFSCASTLPI